MNADLDAPLWRSLLPPGTAWVRRSARRQSAAYLALPSVDQAVVVVSRDPLILRYVAGSVLSTPPGGGRLRSMAYAVGLRLLRLPGGWTVLGGTFRSRLTVLVERRP